MRSPNRPNLTTILVSLSVGIIIVFSGLNAHAEEWTAEQKEVWNVVEQYYRNIDNGDAASTMSLIHDKALELYSDNPNPLNKDQIKTAKDTYVSVKPTTKIKPISINIVDHKVANAFYYFKWESKNATYSNNGRTMQTFIKQGDKWLSIGSLSASCDQKAPCPYGW